MISLTDPIVFKQATAIEIKDNEIEATILGKVVRYRFKLSCGDIVIDASIDGYAWDYNAPITINALGNLWAAAEAQQFDLSDAKHDTVKLTAKKFMRDLSDRIE